VTDTGRLPRRAMQAQQTQRDIVAAARTLFARQGYAKTSVAQIAEEAGVSVQTIYDSVGSKRAIVRHLNDLIDEVGGVAPLAARIATETDPHEIIHLAVMITRQINERCEDLVRLVYAAPAAEPDLFAVRDESMRRHRAGIHGLTMRLESLGALREGLPTAEAEDVIAAMLTPQVVRTFVFDLGWTFDRYEEWVLALLVDKTLKLQT
jgi:AcrR family transcriptional regulator